MDAELKRGRGPLMVAAASALLAVGALLHQLSTPADVSWGWAFRGFILIVGLPYLIVGLAIRHRNPENRVGLLVQYMGLFFMFGAATSEYALRGLVVDPGSVPGALAGAWLLQWLWVVMFGLSMFVFLLFPNGRYSSDRWRRFGYYCAFAILVSSVAIAVQPGILDSFVVRPRFENPLGWEPMRGIGNTFLMFWLVGLGGAAVSLFIRFRRSAGIERQQLKWLAAGAVFTVAAFSLAGAVQQSSYGLGEGVTTIGIIILPASIGASILRYRLYEIDVLINRALVYSLLTAGLALAYVGLVFMFQALLAPFTAESDLAIAASTLGVAALFGPVRTRVQEFIDRRFYRRKFDAEQTVAEFSVRLRNEVELNAVTSELTGVVLQTMQPAHVSLWLRSEPS